MVLYPCSCAPPRADRAARQDQLISLSLYSACSDTADDYKTRHGIGYSVLYGEKNKIAAEVTAFVPIGDNCEILKVSVTNKDASPRSISLFSYVEFCLWNAMDDMTNFQRNYSTGEVEIDGSTIYHKTEYRERRKHYAIFSVNAPVDAYDTNRDSFLGVYGSPAAPEAIQAGKLTNSHASGWSPIGAHELDLDLAAGETKTFVFVLGYIENEKEDKWEAPGILDKSLVHLQRRHAGGQVHAHGQHMASVPVHGHVQHVPLRFLL